MAREAAFLIHVGRGTACPCRPSGEYPLDAVGKLAGRRDARLRGAAAAQHEHLGRKRIEHPRAARRPACIPTPFSKTW
jgi:hypothetical protein